MEYIILVIISIVAIVVTNNMIKANKVKKEKAELAELLSKPDNIFIKLNKHKSDLDSKYKNIFFKKSEQAHYKKLFLELQAEFLEFTNKFEKHLGTNESYNFWKSTYPKLDQFLEGYKNRFVQTELENNKLYFDKLTKFGLDDQQRYAVVIDEDHNLVIAGAGTGKTTTIFGKVKYLTEKRGIKPENILLLSFTKSSANDLVERINVPKLQASTFHALGFSIFRDANKHKFNVISEAEIAYFIKNQLQQQLKNPVYLELVVNYFLHYLKEYKPQFDFESQNDYIQYIKDNNFRPYYRDTKQTYKMDVVKSLEECAIANFLYFNNIEYEYEPPYDIDENDPLIDWHRYRPDFKIYRNKELNDYIYLEHFAINRKGEVPKWFKTNSTGKSATKLYNDAIDWKRNLHKCQNTTLIESYSYEFFEQTVFENLKFKLKEQGISIIPKSNDEIFEIIQNASKQEYKAFEDLIGTFIGLMKSNLHDIASLKLKANTINDDYERTRAVNFLKIVDPIFLAYEEYLKSTVKIDFNDMINQAIDLVKNGQYNKKIDYIIIDEYQDIAYNRYSLIKELLNANPNSKLFCVGDDWQSIYRFAASDIGLFIDFEKFFGYTEISYIETTYRFGKNLITLSNNFILKNPYQSKKQLKAKLSSNNDIQFINYDANQSVDNIVKDKGINILRKIEEEGVKETFINYYGKFDSELKHLDDVFNQLYLKYDNNLPVEDVLFLARYNYIFENLKKESKYYNIKFDIVNTLDENNNNVVEYFISKRFDDGTIIKGRFMSVHKSKGLEAKVVVLFRCDAGKYGFPSEISDDRVLNLLLSSADQFPNGEERRLFYVALTRAKEKLVVISDINNRSKFINEIAANHWIFEEEIKICPSCNNAPLKYQKRFMSKAGLLFDKFICRNYAYGCYHSEVKKVAS